MITMIAHHAVTDYEAWRSVAKEARKNTERNAQSGIVASKAFRTADGSGVIVMHTFNNLEAAQKYEKMMQSPEGHAMVEKNGAKLPITIWLVEEVEL
jgi:signal recognition particle GTPase